MLYDLLAVSITQQSDVSRELLTTLCDGNISPITADQLHKYYSLVYLFYLETPGFRLQRWLTKPFSLENLHDERV